MMRLLILLLLLYVLTRLIFGPPFHFRFLSQGVFPKSKKKPRHPDAEEMVACAGCGTFVSKREAEERGGRYYCKSACHR